MIRPIERESKGSLTAGQDLVAAGFIGRAGAAAIAEYKKEELARWFTKDYIEQLKEEKYPDIYEDIDQWRQYGMTEWEPVAEGGILAAVWNLFGAYGKGVQFELRAILVEQPVIEVCERFDVNPYRLLSGNCALMAADNGGRLVKELAEKGIPAAVIGHVTHRSAMEIMHGEERGFLERPKKDELFRLLPEIEKV